MSSKRKAASGPATVAAENGDAHTAKRRKLPVSPTIADHALSTLLGVDGLVVGWKKLKEQWRHLSTLLFARLDWTQGWDAANIILQLHEFAFLPRRTFHNYITTPVAMTNMCNLKGFERECSRNSRDHDRVRTTIPRVAQDLARQTASDI